MPIVKEAWFVVADIEGARLMQASATKHGGLHVDEIDCVATTFAAGEHHRPSRISGAGRMAPLGHEHEEKLAHFARELVTWLQHTLVVHAIGSCPLFAPAHLIGALRREAPMALIRKLRECECELAGLSTAQLAEHPKVKAALAG